MFYIGRWEILGPVINTGSFVESLLKSTSKWVWKVSTFAVTLPHTADI